MSILEEVIELIQLNDNILHINQLYSFFDLGDTHEEFKSNFTENEWIKIEKCFRKKKHFETSNILQNYVKNNDNKLPSKSLEILYEIYFKEFLQEAETSDRPTLDDVFPQELKDLANAFNKRKS